MNRRELLSRLGSCLALGAVGNKLTMAGEVTSATAATTLKVAGSSADSFSIAHITDVHILGVKQAESWFAKSLHAIQEDEAKPRFILNTGDSVMDTLKTDRGDADKLWHLWRGVTRRELSLPLYQTLGNHDHWGLGKHDLPQIKSDVMYGKKLGLDGFGIERGYHSFDHGNWHFIALDSCQPTGEDNGAGWISRLDEAQFEWLKFDLTNTPADRHVLVYCHVPILQVASMIKLEPAEDKGYRFGAGAMHTDARQIIDLFDKHPNVKLCLSGHLHLHDRVDLAGKTYINAGATSGGWWNGEHHGCWPGYSIINLHADGTFDYRYKTYGWKPSQA